jgi:hypothetical protein
MERVRKIASQNAINCALYSSIHAQLFLENVFYGNVMPMRCSYI